MNPVLQVVPSRDIARIVGDPAGGQCALGVLENDTRVDAILCHHCVCHLQSHQEEDQRVHTSVRRVLSTVLWHALVQRNLTYTGLSSDQLN